MDHTHEIAEHGDQGSSAAELDPPRAIDPPRGIDPVCGMSVDPSTARHRADHRGTTYAFCCAGCRTKFEADPARYLEPDAGQLASERASSASTAIHTCPMHPEIRQSGPGSCPICGMALEPVEVTAEEQPNPELIDMSRRLWIGAALTIPVVALDMGGRAFGVPESVSVWVQGALAVPVVLWAGWPFFVRGWASVVGRALNMFSLIALGTAAAFLFSVVALLAPGVFPSAFRDPAGLVPVYFESAAVIVVLVLLGQVLELRARERTGGAIRALLRLAPRTARRLRADGSDEEIDVAAIAPGDRLRLRPGDAVPVDGAVVEGRSALDESMVTGEPIPVAKTAGDILIAGTVNGTGAIVMRADHVGAETTLARMVALVAEAQRSRAPIQRLADRVAGWFVPAVIAVATVAFAGWAIWGPVPAVPHALIAAVSVLIVACPCALGLAAPMSVGVAMGKGAGMGVLVRSAEALERMERVDTLLVDKTGTLTQGRPVVTRIAPAAGWSETSVLAFAAALERSSEHPLAAALLARAEADSVTVPMAEDFASVTGKGIRGRVSGRAVLIGNEALLSEAGIPVDDRASEAERLRSEGAIVLFVTIDGAAAGLVAIEDPVKESAAAAVAALRRDGIRVVMLTGDASATAWAVARRLGIDDVRAGLLPEEKHAVVVELRRAGRVVAMAGDGVNDAPALAAADIGIAMGSGTEVAMRSAPVTLVRGDLAGIARARALSRATMRSIRQNLVFAFAYNVLGIPLAAGALYPVFGLLPSPELAALAMSLSSVSVIGNALRLRAAAL